MIPAAAAATLVLAGAWIIHRTLEARRAEAAYWDHLQATTRVAVPYDWTVDDLWDGAA